ncbi:flagellar hook-basal body protein [Thermovibrio ammonificans HB-1]|uniref:Flagellar hook-basal body protein n=1 Tax=Thermovibrio ammonificans (strain DSM 15698 / JCM 12110 / HB-1) TaxID=648996 RepID=E8T498_THEA1|nr:flagellar basal-body rod protein FlgF [Thermovibrio ammonificans]ADU97427.1 flagellar hook-basal body protein [Thermovibrio ammonificans HB-1]
MAVDTQTIYLLAAGGERALEQLDTTTNNLANVNTPGFKRIIEEEMSQHVPPNGSDAYNMLIFPRFKSTQVVLSEGPLRKTDSPFDLALKGRGFFAVKTPNGELYTRNGHFTLNANGVLVDANGNPVLDISGKEIALSGNGKVTVTPDGLVFEGDRQVGVLKIVDFAKVKPVGNSYYQGVGAPTATDAEVLQGFLEGSNVNPVKEMVNLIEAQRRFEIYGNLTRALAQVDLRTNEIGKV